MKRIMIILALLATVAGQSVLANEGKKVNPQAKRTFEKQFPGAHYASWQRLDNEDIYLVRFGYDGKSLVAYIGEDGILLATVRNLFASSLPFSVSEKIAKSYSGYEIKLIEELTIESETSYLMLLENEKAKLTIRMYGNGDSYLVKKVRKKMDNSMSKK